MRPSLLIGRRHRSFARIPRINHVYIKIGEMPDISRSKLGPTCDDDPSYLRIAHIAPDAIATPHQPLAVNRRTIPATSVAFMSRKP